MTMAHEMNTLKEDRRIREMAVDWLLRLEAEPEDCALAEACMRWREKDVRHNRAFEKAFRTFGDSRILLRQDIEFAKKASGHAAKKTHKRGLGHTALAIALIGMSTGTFIAFDGPMRLQADVMSAYDEMPVIHLSDGSTVHLNAHSAIKVRINDKERHITLLRGEAYFEVAPDPARPFSVAAGNGETLALGTAFNVNLKDEGVDVTVTHHAVKVHAAPLPQDEASPISLRLEQGFSVSYNENGGIGTATPVDLELAAPWRNGRLIFENRPLGEVVEEIARHLPGKVMIASAALRERRITGTFDLTTPDQAFDDFITAFDLKSVSASRWLTVLHP